MTEGKAWDADEAFAPTSRAWAEDLSAPDGILVFTDAAVLQRFLGSYPRLAPASVNGIAHSSGTLTWDSRRGMDESNLV